MYKLREKDIVYVYPIKNDKSNVTFVGTLLEKNVITIQQQIHTFTCNMFWYLEAEGQLLCLIDTQNKLYRGHSNIHCQQVCYFEYVYSLQRPM